MAGRLALDEGRQIISHESIYRFIYVQMARKKDYAWRHYLPRAKAKRGFRGRRGGSPATHITFRVPLSQRPHAAADRATFGHWEGDLMHFGNHGPALLALAERHSRLVLLARLPGKGADVTADTIARLLAPLPPAWRQTITFDNGTEFARHYRLHALGIQTFFCDTRSPWQKGGVENAIGRLRRPLPRKTRLADLSEAAFTRIIQLYNNTPRKCLGYRTPAETLDDQVLHLECELTFPLSRERRWGSGCGRWWWRRGRLLVAVGPSTGSGRTDFGSRACGGEWGMRTVGGRGAKPGACLGKGFHRNDACGRPFDRLRANGIANGPCDGVWGVRSARKSVVGGGGSAPAPAPRVLRPPVPPSISLRANGLPGPAPPLWIPAFAGMTLWGVRDR